MKKYSFTKLWNYAFLLVMLSCTDEADNKETSDIKLIIGTWVLSATSTTNCDDPADNESSAISCTSTGCIKITFKSDGTYKEMDVDDDNGTQVYTGTYTTNNGEITLCSDDYNPCDEITLKYKISNSTLTITSIDVFGNGCDFNLIFTKD
jgi:hypothetical protein